MSDKWAPRPVRQLTPEELRAQYPDRQRPKPAIAPLPPTADELRRQRLAQERTEKS